MANKINYLYKVKVCKNNDDPFFLYFVSRNIKTLKSFIKENHSGVKVLDVLKIGEDKFAGPTREFTEKEKITVENYFNYEQLKMIYADQLIKGESTHGEEEKYNIYHDRLSTYPRKS